MYFCVCLKCSNGIIILKVVFCIIVGYVIYAVISLLQHDAIVLYLALFVYTTLWHQNILVLSSPIADCYR